MKGHSLYFEAPGKVTVRETTIPSPDPNQVMVQTIASAISPGTEMLLYRGQLPPDLPLDTSIDALANQSGQYPVQYGYAAVGRVIEIGHAVSPDWRNQLVFAFQPHQSHFVTTPEQLWPLPEGMSPETAVFLPNMETTVNLVMDGAPLIGERVAVFGQGIVGLLTTALLANFPLAELITLDRYANRRAASLEIGATLSLDPFSGEAVSKMSGPFGLDLVYEVSGTPAALDQAIEVTGFGGRIVIGSWYGTKPANLNLGGAFHRSRIQLISSQVSTISPALTGRWNKTRRFNLAWEMIRQVEPQRLITHALPFEDAAQAYTLLDQHSDKVIQVLLSYK